MSSPRKFLDKPALSLEEQIKLLSRRGLLIQDPSRAFHYLQYIGYYRLSGYFWPFQVPNDHEHKFQADTSFD
ncbi:Abi family protein [Desulfonatronospira thiodismutans]|uniref:Abi family protein n=1 Tax=Desulfonatronospira thiodismutans TaxID=488939 RepID=UPI0011866E0D